MKHHCPQCSVPIFTGQKHCGNCGTLLLTTEQLTPEERTMVAQNLEAEASTPVVITASQDQTSSTIYASTPIKMAEAEHIDTAEQSDIQPTPRKNEQAFVQPNYVYYPQAAISNAGGNPSYAQVASSSTHIPAGYPPYAPYPAYPSPSPKKPWSKAVFIIGGIILILLVVMCGSLFAVVNSTLTGGTPQSDTTIAATPTTDTQQDSNSPITTGKQLFSDDFADNKNQWGTTQQDGYGASIQNHTLIMYEANSKNFIERIPGGESWSDFRLEMTYSQDQAHSMGYVGALFRRHFVPANQGIRGYELKIVSSTGQYVIKKITDPPANHPSGQLDTVTTLASGFLNTTPKIDTPMRVTLIAKGNEIALYANGEFVTSCADQISHAYTSGPLTLLVQGSSTYPAKVTFSHIAVYEAPNTIPNS